MTEKRKLYREYTKTFEDNGLKWEEVYVTTFGPSAESPILYINNIEIYLLRRRPPPRRLRHGVTFKFYLTTDNTTSVYWAMQGLHQGDAKVLAELKAVLK